MKKHRKPRKRRKTRKKRKTVEEKYENIKILVAATLVILISAISSYMLYAMYSSPQPKTALIIDGLSVEFNNKEFIDKITYYFKEAGYDVEIYNGTEVTVDTYRKMFSSKYRVIILRVHSAPGDGVIVPKNAIVFFTGERTRVKKYFTEQLIGFVVKAKTLTRAESFYAVTPSFIRNTPGKLENAVVIVLSCYGTLGSITIEAFMSKGATVYIGWNGEVSPEYMDKAGLYLIENLVVKRLSVDEAVRETMLEVGPDPFFGSYLEYYPPNAGSYKL